MLLQLIESSVRGRFKRQQLPGQISTAPGSSGHNVGETNAIVQ